MAAHDSDEWWMAQVAGGRHDALDPLVRRYARPLYGFILRLVRDAGRAEELFQDVFLAVWLKRRRYRAGKPFKPWLYAIALNRCRSDLRRVPRAGLELFDVPGDTESPSGVLVAGETARLVAEAVDRLPPRQKAVVLLRVWEDLPYSTIGECVGCTEATARSHMAHALAAVRRVLEPQVR